MWGGDGEDLATGAAGVLGGGVEQDAHPRPGFGRSAEAAAADPGGAGGGRGEIDHDPHRRGLAGAVGAEEAWATRPGRAVNVTSSTAVKPPYDLVRSRP